MANKNVLLKHYQKLIWHTANNVIASQEAKFTPDAIVGNEVSGSSDQFHFMCDNVLGLLDQFIWRVTPFHVHSTRCDSETGFIF